MSKEIEAIWKELNEQWGTDLEIPEGMEEDIENFSMSAVRYEMAMGSSFDAAVQSQFRS